MEKVFNIFANLYIGLDVVFIWVCSIIGIILFFLWVVALSQRLVEWLRDKFRKDDE